LKKAQLLEKLELIEYGNILMMNKFILILKIIGIMEE
jgi:hypothetical protein